jgi:glucosamine-6-phosphate deaminase
MLIACGLGKADALHKMMEVRAGPSVPASLLVEHPDLTVFADRDAASKLDPSFVESYSGC